MSKKIRITLVFALSLMSAGVQTVRAEESDNFYNAPENINTDPNYVPGAYALPEVQPARTVYQAKRDELAAAHDLLNANTLVTLNAGQVTFAALKNETVEVLGYFRGFFGVLTIT